MLGLLPWEKWLPPYVFAPLLCVGSAVLFFMSLSDPHWWELVFLPLASIFGGWGSWRWFKYRENVFLLGVAAKNERSKETDGRDT